MSKQLFNLHQHTTLVMVLWHKCKIGLKQYYLVIWGLSWMSKWHFKQQIGGSTTSTTTSTTSITFQPWTGWRVTTKCIFCCRETPSMSLLCPNFCESTAFIGDWLPWTSWEASTRCKSHRYNFLQLHKIEIRMYYYLTDLVAHNPQVRSLVPASLIWGHLNTGHRVWVADQAPKPLNWLLGSMD